MAHYALLDKSNIVLNVIVGMDENTNNIDWESTYQTQYGYTCKRTSYNMYGGVHRLGGIPFRKNYAGRGFLYDETRDAFIPPKPYDSWTLNEETCLWESPTPYPDDGSEYRWDESTTSWVQIEI